MEVGGVPQSTKAAESDRDRVYPLIPRFINAAGYWGIPPAILAGIASRESQCGMLLDKNGFGDGGNAYGIMQVDKRFHVEDHTSYAPDSLAHINFAASILKTNLTILQRKHGDWPLVRQLQGAIAAYNCGVGNIKTQHGIDIGTTHNDYSNDVWARALHFMKES
jgi:soluble lytic murein transglycosylase-like protein